MLTEKGFVLTAAASYTGTLVPAAEKGGVFCVCVPIQKNGRKCAKKRVSLCIYREADQTFNPFCHMNSSVAVTGSAQ